MTFAACAKSFYASLDYTDSLPPDVEVMNPYRVPHTLRCVEQFYDTFYSDTTPRVGIFGINPGRFGAGLTGISFTDPVALRQHCGIENTLGSKKELSSEYVYKSIEHFGGVQQFFSSFYLSALCPLGFTKQGVNYNFYDEPGLQKAVLPFMLHCMQQQLSFPLRRDTALCFGTGKLKAVFEAFNSEHSFFQRIEYLEHPRFIMQYRRKQLDDYLQKYHNAFRAACEGVHV